MMTSASISSPERRRIPAGVNRSMCPVITRASPSRMARKMSPSGALHTRWSHGRYGGVKFFSISSDEMKRRCMARRPALNNQGSRCAMTNWAVSRTPWLRRAAR